MAVAQVSSVALGRRMAQTQYLVHRLQLAAVLLAQLVGQVVEAAHRLLVALLITVLVV